jgi:crotonobetainyl-CoA:carnitine CoA-transferase CaiB-like acyl-CoA transferase
VGEPEVTSSPATRSTSRYVGSGPIDGLRVVDCSRDMAGVRLTGTLADYGADVVWVERPGGEPCRLSDPAATSVLARGKRSIELDLTDSAEVQDLLQLIDRADVLVATWAPGEADPLGLGYESLSARNPALVYCSISGFGEDDHWRDFPYREAIVHALVGTMGMQQGHRGGPIYSSVPFAAMGAAHLGVIGILACLLRRNADGCGRHVTTSLFDGALAYHSYAIPALDPSSSDDRPTSRTSTETMRMVTRSFECADGKYLGVHTGARGAFGRLMKVLGLDDRIPPSESGLDFGQPLDPDQAPILLDEVPQMFASASRDHWLNVLSEADVCAVEHLHPTEVFDTPQAIHNNMVVTLEDPVLGPVEQVAPVIRLPWAVVGGELPAPLAGQHTVDVLAAWAGWALPDGGTQPSPDTRPLLDGVRILDVGIYYAGPFASRLLADLGADVIKLEPVLGDPARGIESVFRAGNAGKRSVAADLKDPRLSPVRDGLLRWADVVQHNLRPGVAERLGIDRARVHELNPSAIYLYSPGWGATGPCARRQAFAPMLSGYTGVGFEVAGQFNPPMPPFATEDPGNGLVGATAILLALLERQRTGAGVYAENPQLNAAMLQVAHIVRRPGGEVLGANVLDPLQLGRGTYERLYMASDGWVCIDVSSEFEKSALAQVLGIELSDDDDIASAALADAIATWQPEALTRRLLAAGVPAAVPVPLGYRALLSDSSEGHFGRIVEVNDVDRGKVRELGCLIRVSGADVAPHRAAPSLGSHSVEILEMLGHERPEIDALRASSVLR